MIDCVISHMVLRVWLSHRHTERERERDRQTSTHGKTYRHTGRHTGRQTDGVDDVMLQQRKFGLTVVDYSPTPSLARQLCLHRPRVNDIVVIAAVNTVCNEVLLIEIAYICPATATEPN